MRILIIGGTRLVGRQIAAAAIDRGHDVTLFNRGKTAPDGLAGAAQLVGDRDRDLSALASGGWDATIDACAYTAKQVRTMLDALGERAGRYAFVSTISVFSQDIPESGLTEDAPLLPPEWSDQLTMDKYGELKVACEQVASELASDRLLVVRPGYVIGPYDYTERFTHWIRAVAKGEPFDAPAADQPLQAIDGRDLGAFTVTCLEDQRTDTFNVTAPQDPPTFREVIDTIGGALGVPVPEVRWSDPDSESEDLPLAAGRSWWPTMRADVSKAVAAGLQWRPLADTVRDTAAHVGL
jgi:2'-hydroxyisoflavone reductase